MPPFYAFDRALLRAPARSVVKGLRAVDRGAPTWEGVAAEHAAYAAALEAAGVTLRRLPALEDFPDSIFVEDPALVFSEGAILLRPGAPSREGETALIAPVLHEEFARVIPWGGAGFADGGDVLNTPSGVMIGLSARTDRTGGEALIKALAELGLKGRLFETPKGVLHFKSDCSLLDEETVLSTARLAASGAFKGLKIIETAPGEEDAANALRVNGVVLASDAFPRTLERLTKAGFNVVALKTDQIRKIDAGLSCMSLRWRRAA